MIFVFSNRNVINNESWLGDSFNTEGNDNIRVAKYIPSARPKLSFYSEHEAEALPSLKVIQEIENGDKPCCIFIHGFNQSLTKNMKKCEEIESYGVNVIAFSWPSNPGPQAWYWKIREYKRAVQNARRSTVALERFFDKFHEYFTDVGRVSNIKSMVIHSLGNFLLQSFVSSTGFNNQTSFLNNILLHQADVNSQGHEKWADHMTMNSRVMVTINETDNVLDASDIINPDRLGNTLRNLNSKTISYFNFGQLDVAEDKHRLWIKPTITNENAASFFEEVFKGKKIKTSHLDYNNRNNHFNIK